MLGYFVVGIVLGYGLGMLALVLWPEVVFRWLDRLADRLGLP